jgi:hypothetical protein
VKRVVVALAFAAAALCITTGTAHASSSPVWYIQYNLCGNVCNHGDLDPAIALSYEQHSLYALGISPVGGSMEEVCTDPGGIAVDQIEYLDTAFAVPSLPGYDYQFLHWALKEVNDSNCEYEGPGVFAYGLLSGTQTGFNVYGTQDSDVGTTGNVRAWLCLSMPVGASAHSVCGTHLSFHHGTSIVQSREINSNEGVFSAIHPGVAHFLGGDFNRTYCQMRTDTNIASVPNNNSCPYGLGPESLYVDRFESNDFQSPIINTIDSEDFGLQKYDYAFIRRVGFGSAAIFPMDSGVSDHTMVVAAFQ